MKQKTDWARSPQCYLLVEVWGDFLVFSFLFKRQILEEGGTKIPSKLKVLIEGFNAFSITTICSNILSLHSNCSSVPPPVSIVITLRSRVQARHRQAEVWRESSVIVVLFFFFIGAHPHQNTYGGTILVKAYFTRLL